MWQAYLIPQGPSILTFGRVDPIVGKLRPGRKAARIDALNLFRKHQHLFVNEPNELALEDIEAAQITTIYERSFSGISVCGLMGFVGVRWQPEE